MKKLIHMLRVTIVSGVLFMIPLILIIMILGKAIELLRYIVRPVANKLPIESLIGLETPSILAFVLLLVLCFAAGLLARTKTAKKMIDLLEDKLLSNLPGYSFLKNVGEEVAGSGATHQYQSVLARFDDAWQLGFLVERIEGGRVVVFIPGSPSPWAGSTFIFDEERITLIDEATNKSIKVLQKLGIGTGELVKGKI